MPIIIALGKASQGYSDFPKKKKKTQKLLRLELVSKEPPGKTEKLGIPPENSFD